MSTETNRATHRGVVMSILGTEIDDLRFCRRLSADVNQGPLYLSQVMVMGRQIYPFHNPVLGGADMLFRCEFRPRNVSMAITQEHIENLLGRLRTYQVVEGFFVDESGAIADRVELPVAIG